MRLLFNIVLKSGIFLINITALFFYYLFLIWICTGIVFGVLIGKAYLSFNAFT